MGEALTLHQEESPKDLPDKLSARVSLGWRLHQAKQDGADDMLGGLVLSSRTAGTHLQRRCEGTPTESVRSSHCPAVGGLQVPIQVNQAMRQRRQRSSEGDLPGSVHRKTVAQETESRVSMKESPRKGVSCAADWESRGTNCTWPV